MSLPDNQNNNVAVFDELTQIRKRRAIQVIACTMVGMLTAGFAADSYVRTFLLLGGVSLLVSLLLARTGRPNAAMWVFLWTLTIILSMLAWASGGIRDMAMLAYPCLLGFAVILGNSRLFFGLLFAILSYCALLTFLTINGYFTMYLPEIGYQHLVFVCVIFSLSGFSVFLLFSDVRRLMKSLQIENRRASENQATIVKLAHSDQLTGLPNRRHLEQEFPAFLSNARRAGCKLGVIFIDMDNFKPVNDSMGHAAGDLLLQQLSRRLQNVMSTPHHIICRFGGDEFLVMVLVDSVDELRQYAEQLLECATVPFFIMQTQVDISVSIGVSWTPDHGDDFSSLCRAADVAMYHAKAKGRNAVCLYSCEMEQANSDKFLMLKRLRDAIKHQEFELHYQPKCTLAGERPYGVEALIRWPDGQGGYIPPDDFIPLAENSGLIIEIGQWVVEEACRACAQWHAQGLSDLSVAVNISYVQFLNEGLLETVKQVLQETQLPAHLLELELTESLLISENDSIQRQLNAMQELGISLAIDDFGTGYSNLGYLRRFKAKRLKIDKSFVMDLGTSSRDEPLVRAMITMAHSLGMLVVAEGVEDIQVLEQLKSMGCDEGQGYLWAKALPQHELLAYLAEHCSELGNITA